MKTPSWTAHEVSGASELTLFEVRTDTGLVGYGEVQGGPQKLIRDLAAQYSD